MHTIREARPADVRRMVHAMRPDDRAEIAAFGLDPKRLLRWLAADSVFVRAAEVDGSLAVLWGVQGQLAADTAYPWLFTAAPIERAPFAFAREARREVRGMLAQWRRLRVDAAATYQRSIRFWRLMGFRVGEPEPVPPHGVLFCSLTMEAV